MQLTTLDKLISTAADQHTSLIHLISPPSFATPRRTTTTPTTTTTTTLFGAILACDLPLITFQKHACFACQHLKTPSARSLEHYRLFKGHSPQTLPHSIVPPPQLPKTTTTTTTTTTTAASSSSSSSSSLKYLPPIVFYPRAVIGGEETALILQLLMEFGIDFQTAQPAKASPLITNYEDCLKLPHNNPPLTNYPIPTEQAATMARYKDLHTKLSTLLNQHQLSILMADKGSGMLLIRKSTVMLMYTRYAGNFPQQHAQLYKQSLQRLKAALLTLNNDTHLLATDDRLPTFYFKIKVHKAAFQKCCLENTTHPHLFHFQDDSSSSSSSSSTTNNNNDDDGDLHILYACSRAIANHQGCITTLCGNYLKKIIDPAIQASEYLTEDVFETIEKITRPSATATATQLRTTPHPPRGGPATIYTADVAAFYPSTPHLQIKLAFDCFFPTRSDASHLLAKLLEYNYITDGLHIHAGEIGIPMGLTIAPQLARLTTAFMLRHFQLPSPTDSLTLYYDDVADTSTNRQKYLQLTNGTRPIQAGSYREQ